MENMDITDPTFNLDVLYNTDMDMDMNNLHNYFSNTFLDNYIIIIFISLGFISIIIYKYYYKPDANTEYNNIEINENVDCPGGFCTMNNKTTPV